jgi:hypothetical protein
VVPKNRSSILPLSSGYRTEAVRYNILVTTNISNENIAAIFTMDAFPTKWWGQRPRHWHNLDDQNIDTEKVVLSSETYAMLSIESQSMCGGCWMMDVGSITTTTQIILDINWCITLFTLVIHSVCVRLEVILEPCRSGPLCTHWLADWLHCSKSTCSFKLKVKVTLQPTVSQSVIMSRIEHFLGLVTRYYFMSEGCFLKFADLSLWGALSDERSGSVICLSQSSNLPLFTSKIYVTYVLQFSSLYTINIKLQSVPSEYSRLYSTSYY